MRYCIVVACGSLVSKVNNSDDKFTDYKKNFFVDYLTCKSLVNSKPIKLANRDWGDSISMAKGHGIVLIP